MTTLNLTKPDQGASREVTPRVKSISFGDGYEMRAGDGINTLSEVWSLSWTGRLLSEITALDTFMKTQAGILWFYWTTPLGVTLKFMCKKWSVSYNNDYDSSMTATFTQDFGL